MDETFSPVAGTTLPGPHANRFQVLAACATSWTDDIDRARLAHVTKVTRKRKSLPVDWVRAQVLPPAAAIAADGQNAPGAGNDARKACPRGQTGRRLT